MRESAVHVVRTDEELTPLLKLRYRIFVEQQRKPLPGVDLARGIVCDRFDSAATHFYVNDEIGGIVACGRATLGEWPEWCDPAFSVPALATFQRSQLYYISKVMMNPDLRSPSAISKIFVAMYRNGRSAGAPFGIANCNPKLVPLYVRFGWRQFGPTFQDPYAGEQVPILIVAHDAEYLRKTNRQLFEASQEFANDPVYSGWFEKHFAEYSG